MSQPQSSTSKVLFLLALSITTLAATAAIIYTAVQVINQPKSAQPAHQPPASAISRQDGRATFSVDKPNIKFQPVQSPQMQPNEDYQLAIIPVTITNHSSKPLSISVDQQVLHTQNHQTILGNQQLQTIISNDHWYQNIPANQSKTGSLIFQIPLQAQLDYLEFHVKPDSPGATLNLQ